MVNYAEYAIIRSWTLVLYGTAIPSHDDDEPLIIRQQKIAQIAQSPPILTQPVPPPPIYYYPNVNYPLTNFVRPIGNSNYTSSNFFNLNNGNNGNKDDKDNNKKQQQNQNSQQKTEQQGNQKGNSQQNRKNGKNKNGKNGKNNNNVNNNGSRNTTPRPSPTTVFNYTNGYKNANNKQKVVNNNVGGNANSKKLDSIDKVTTLRPQKPPPQKPDKEKVQSKTNQNANDYLVGKADQKYHQSYSNSYEKSSGKAPKQVKENKYTTAIALIEFITPTPKPSISKMFEKYTKIQQFYPELKPYRDSSNNHELMSFSQQSPQFTVSSGNGKPSRDNQNQKNFNEFIAAELPQKKIPNEFSFTRVNTQTANGGSSAQKNGKGT